MAQTKKEKRLFRTDILPMHGNAGKNAKLDALLMEYRKAAALIAERQWELFFVSGRFDKFDKQKPDTILPAAFVQMCRAQVVGVLDSFNANRINDIRKLIAELDTDDIARKQLYYINAYQCWLRPETTMRGEVIPQDVQLQARKLFEQVLEHHHKPTFDHIGMNLDTRAFRINSEGNSFSHWLTLSTLDKGKRTQIPLVAHKRFLDRNGDDFRSINIIKQGEAFACAVPSDCTATINKSRAKYQSEVVNPDKVIGIDLGLCFLMATSSGDLLGRDWIRKLSKYDKVISALAAHRQRMGLKPSSPRYHQLVQSLRGMIKSEINRCLNRIVAIHHPAEIVVEDTVFQSPHLSKRVNRLIQNFGKGVFTRKLEALEEELGIKVTYVAEAYSSQTHYKCGYVDKRNRISRDRFHCRHCGAKIHADVNAAREIVARCSSSLVAKRRNSIHKRHVLGFVLERFLSRNPSGFSSQVRAAEPFASNLYFSGVVIGDVNCKRPPRLGSTLECK